MYEFLIENDSADPILRTEFASFLLNLDGLENKSTALEQINFVLAQNADDTNALYLGALINKKVGELNMAKELLSRLINIDPNDTKASQLYNEINHELSSFAINGK